jgi:hypothetical protein
MPTIARIRPAFWSITAGITLVASACGRGGHYSYELKSGAKVLASCDDATANDLTPEGGGFKLVCAADGVQVYFVNRTGPGADGSLLNISVEDQAKRQLLLPAVDAGDPKHKDLDCPSAKALARKTGEKPIPARTTGKWTLAMAQPCGDLVVTIGEAKKR